ncbi:hypothetical protein B1813_00195 [Saccharomonospora piscinae]|uniref:Uncharacterized protein n=1 Tax=Saccharomonospora piscinae TaxID=687388 RepID=A0A1V9ABZ6_SACPI|nr:hypothetical protein [Saccharomonospora piscinae]OQO94578.1 hypothetical protein B1813_00195 [Saccharomonospora piscinae]
MSTTNPNAPVTPIAAPPWLRELAHARSRYIELLGWPIEIHIGSRSVIVPVGETLDSITMPPPLARAVQAELRITMLAGPVVTGPENDTWTFFTQPTATTALPPGLAELRVIPAARGHCVPLPQDLHCQDGCCWVETPGAHPALPPWPAVVATTRRVVARNRPRIRTADPALSLTA